MSDPRIEIVRSWLGEDNPWENVDRLLSRLDAASSQPADLVERVAKAIESMVTLATSTEYDMAARAAISVLPAPMSSADREIVEAAESWFESGRLAALYSAVLKKRSTSREGKR